MPSNAPVIISIMSFVLVATQVVFTKLLAAPSGKTEQPIPFRADVRRISLMGVLAIPAGPGPHGEQKPSVHIATSVMEMAQTFGRAAR